jgi:hypothetical protein
MKAVSMRDEILIAFFTRTPKDYFHSGQQRGLRSTYPSISQLQAKSSAKPGLEIKIFNLNSRLCKCFHLGTLLFHSARKFCPFDLLQLLNQILSHHPCYHLLTL